jgi:hypothetical protein
VSARRPTPAESRDPEQRLRSTEALLEFLDLRELQDVICSKATWSRFSAVFATKETLATRFSQLAGLRNAIRHSRTITDITLKDGEAALLWFEQALQSASMADSGEEAVADGS